MFNYQLKFTQSIIISCLFSKFITDQFKLEFQLSLTLKITFHYQHRLFFKKNIAIQ